MLIKRFEGDPNVVVEAVTPGAPAATCGLIRPGDRLVSVDGHSVALLSLDAIHDLIDGPAGGSITLVLQRAGGSGATPRSIHPGGWSGSPEGGGGFFGAFSAARNALAGSSSSSPRQSLELVRGDSPRDAGEYRVTLVRMGQGMHA